MADPRELLTEALVHLRAINTVLERLLATVAPASQGVDTSPEALASAWADLPEALRCHPGVKRLYRIATLGVAGTPNWRAVVGEPVPVIPPANPDLQPGGKHDRGVPASPKWCPECRSAGVVGIEQDVCPTCDGLGIVASGVQESEPQPQEEQRK